MKKMSAAMDVSAYKEEHPPRSRPRKTGAMDAFKKEILDLNASGYSLNQIQEWLKNNGTEVSRAAIHAYLKRILVKPKIQVIAHSKAQS